MLQSLQIGTTSLGQPIDAFRIGRGPCAIALVGGMHGDEIEGVFLLSSLLREISLGGRLNGLLAKASLVAVPVLNKDGFHLAQRWTRDRVDLNRNFPTRDWIPTATHERYPPGPRPASEPETRALVSLLEETRPLAVLDFHSYQESVLMPTIAPGHSPLQLMARKLADRLSIRTASSLGYPVHGGLHAWCEERGISHFTYELLRDMPQREIADVYLEPTLAFLTELMRWGIVAPSRSPSPSLAPA
jgi:murein peptide amidase A